MRFVGPTTAVLIDGIAVDAVEGSIVQDLPRSWLWILSMPYGWGKQPSVISLNYDGRLQELPHGWEPTREAAVEAVTRKAASLGGISPLWKSTIRKGGSASSLKSRMADERRKERATRGPERNKDRRGSNAVEYLYYTWTSDYDNETNTGRYRILKRTKERVYFSPHDEGVGFGEVYFVRFADLQKDGHVWHRKVWHSRYTEEAHNRWRAEHEAQKAEQRRRTGNRIAGLDPAEPVHSVQECRREMQRHHPDKGGRRELFELWCRRLEAAKASRA
jgi:hypothetical protein